MTKDTRKKRVQKEKPKIMPKHLEHINQWAAGIDVGSTSHFVAVPEGCDEHTVREFKSFTTGLHELSDWLKKCGIKTVAMESTGVYWIPVYELLEEQGFEVKLVDARQVKNVSGRKTDVLDCQWIQQLHTYGLLNGAFRPDEEICALRSYVRQRTILIQSAAMHIQHMQKALTQMNLQLHQVIADITGKTGMEIIRAIIRGERDPKILARYREPRCKNSLDVIEQALTGHYRAEHLFSLQQSLELYDIYQGKMTACDAEIEKKLAELSPSEIASKPLSSTSKHTKKRSKNAPDFDLQTQLQRLTGVDLTGIPGMNSLTSLYLIGEIGLDMSRWKSAKQFASWLGLCPGNKVSGGKRISGKSKRSANKAAATLRMAASTLYRSSTALGAYLRRLKSRLGPAKAITATAHKIAKIIYNMLRDGIEYKEAGQDYYEQQYRARVVKNLERKASTLGFSLVEKSSMAT
jgi:transposase